MDPALAQPYEHLLRMLTAFAASIRTSQPASAPSANWSRATAHLQQELQRLRSIGAYPQDASGSSPSAPALRSIAVRLTQLARTHDGLRFEHSVAAPATQLVDQRRLVVLAAWQLLQALEHIAAVQPGAGVR